MLKKGPRIVVTPGVAGSPAIPERVVCPSAPPDSSPKPRNRNGYWAQLCIQYVKVGGMYIDTGVPICTKVWVET